MRVKFVRHGQTDLNSPIRKMQGISDYDLNKNGIKQAEETREELINEDFDIIISSPLKRAKPIRLSRSLHSCRGLWLRAVW